MGLMWMAAAAVAVAKREQQNSRSCSRNKQKFEYDYQSKYNYYDCVIAEMFEEKAELYDFFSWLEVEYEKNIEQKKIDIEKYRSELIQKLDLDNSTKKFTKLKLELAKKGIIVTHKFCHFDQEYIYDTHHVDHIPHATSAICFEIDGLHAALYIQAEEISEDNINLVLEEKLHKHQSEAEREEKRFNDMNMLIDELNVKISELSKQIENDSRKLKYTIFKRSKKKHELYLKKEDLEKKNETLMWAKKMKPLHYNLMDYHKNTAYLIEQQLCMSDYEKKLLIESKDEIIKLLEIEKEIIRTEYLLDRLYENRINEDECFSFTLEKLVKEGKITQELLEKIFILLDKVEIKGRRGEYKFENSEFPGRKIAIAKWFIKNVYEKDENFADRNYELPEDVKGKQITKKF